jgi:hypothetical protein
MLGIGSWMFLSVLGAAQDAPAVRAWFEPKSMRAPVTLPLTGAQRTEIALGRLTEDGLERFSKRVVELLGISRERAFAIGRENAAADLATLTPRYQRDRNKVIQYAALTSPRPIVASAVLAPKFLAMFKETLGDEVLVVVPSRFTAYVFPKLASRYQEYYPMVFEAYRATAWPVSVEVFEFSAAGIRAIGVYDEP